MLFLITLYSQKITIISYIVSQKVSFFILIYATQFSSFLYFLHIVKRLRPFLSIKRMHTRFFSTFEKSLSKSRPGISITEGAGAWVSCPLRILTYFSKQTFQVFIHSITFELYLFCSRSQVFSHLYKKICCNIW